MTDRDYGAALPPEGSKVQLPEAASPFKQGDDAEVMYSGRTVVVLIAPGKIAALDPIVFHGARG